MPDCAKAGEGRGHVSHFLPSLQWGDAKPIVQFVGEVCQKAKRDLLKEGPDVRSVLGRGKPAH